LLLLIAILPFVAKAAATIEEIKRIPFTAQVTIKPDGTADVGDISGIKGPLAAFVRTKTAATRFIPGRKDGQAGTATAELSGVVMLTPADGDSYEISLGRISLAPKSRDVSPPLYPRGTSRHGDENSVLLLIRINANGSVAPVRVIHSTNAAFDKATIDQAKKWKFEAQVFDGIPVAVEAPILVEFGSGKMQKPQAEPECVWDELRPRVEGQSCLLDGLVVTKAI